MYIYNFIDLKTITIQAAIGLKLAKLRQLCLNKIQQIYIFHIKKFSTAAVKGSDGVLQQSLVLSGCSDSNHITVCSFINISFNSLLINVFLWLIFAYKHNIKQ